MSAPLPARPANLAERRNGFCVRAIVASAMTIGAQLPGQSSVMSGPASWNQLRGSESNAGVVSGTLSVAWSYNAGRPVRGLAIANGIALVGTESSDADAAAHQFATDQQGLLFALDIKTGSLLWTRRVPSWIHGDPAIYGERAIVTFGRWPMDQRGGALGIDLRTGRTLWSFKSQGGIMPAPAIDSSGKTVVVVSDGVLYLLAVCDGHVLHSAGLQSVDAMSSPRIDGSGYLYVGTTGSVRSYTVSNASLSWEFHSPTLRGILDVPVAISDSLVFTAGTEAFSLWRAARLLPFRRFVSLLNEARRTSSLSSHDGWIQQQWLLAINRRTGRLVWQRALGTGLHVPRNTSGTPVVVGNTVVVSSPVGKTISAFDAGSGRPLWQQPLSAMHRGAVTIISNEIILGDKSGDITIRRLIDGKVVGGCTTGAPFTPFAPMIVGRTIFVATRDGWIHAMPYDSLRHRADLQAHGACY